MEEITRKAYAKINLGLDVIRRRSDGYHEVKMVMQTIGLYDQLSFRKESLPGIRLRTNHAGIPADDGNLIYKAADLILRQYRPEGGVSITLRKDIPIAAGMAGGSTDAAAVFHGLNELFSLGMDMETMCRMGVGIGADIPYCIMGGTALAEGIGEKLTPLPAPPDCCVLIAKPDISVSTKFVYENLHADTLKYHPDIEGMITSIYKGDLQGIIERMGNVLETVTVKEYPIINDIKEQMVVLGAEKALMSGSGPTVFGIFIDREKAGRAYDRLQELQPAGDVFLTSFISASNEPSASSLAFGECRESQIP